jgi:hypothetical protein
MHDSKEGKMAISNKRNILLRPTCYIMIMLLAAGSVASGRENGINDVKIKLLTIGQGKSARAKVELNDGTALQGYVSELNEEDFVIVSKTDRHRIPYSQVAKVKKWKMSLGAKIAIVSLAAVGAMFGLYAWQCRKGCS